MHIEQRVARGLMSVLCLGILLGALILPLQAGDRAAQLVGGKHVPRGGVQPGVPQAGGSPYAPPAFIDRGTPISERPFANRLSTAALPYPSAHWHLSVAAHRSPLVLCPSSGVMGNGLGPTIPAWLYLALTCCFLPCEQRVSLLFLPPHVRPC